MFNGICLLSFWYFARICFKGCLLINEIFKGDDIDAMVDKHLAHCSRIAPHAVAVPADMIPIKRQAHDICVIGKKSRGKSFVLAVNAWLAHLDGKTVFSNMHLNFPYIPVVCLEDFQKLKEYPGRKHFVGDDLENWVSSKFIKNEDKSSILEFTLNAAKYQCDLWFSAKRAMELDKTLRSGVDYFFECNIILKEYPHSVEDYDEKTKYLNNCMIRCDIYDGDGWYLKTEFYTDLDIWGGLFDTSQVVNKIGR